MPVVARVLVVGPEEAQVLVERSGAWVPVLRSTGPDAEAEAHELRAQVEAGLARHAEVPPAPAGEAGWAVRLPNELRSAFEAMAAAWGRTPESHLAGFLLADSMVKSLALAAAQELREREAPAA